MKSWVKEILKRGLIGAGIANFVCLAVGMTVYLCGGDTSGIDIVSFTANQFGYAIIGFASGGAGVLYSCGKFSILKATVIHFCILLTAFVAAYFMAWNYENAGIRVLIPISCFAVSYLITWFCVNAAIKNNIKKINRKLNGE